MSGTTSTTCQGAQHKPKVLTKRRSRLARKAFDTRSNREIRTLVDFPLLIRQQLMRPGFRNSENGGQAVLQ
jgi:hypothetical protein